MMFGHTDFASKSFSSTEEAAVTVTTVVARAGISFILKCSTFAFHVEEEGKTFRAKSPTPIFEVKE